MTSDQHIWRFFATDVTSSPLKLDEDEHHLAFHVLRLSVGDIIEVTDCAGKITRARISKIDKKTCEAAAENIRDVQRGTRHVSLFLGMPKLSALDETIANVAELGVSAIHIIALSKSPTKVTPKLEKIQKQVRAALRINKLAFAPDVFFYSSLEELLKAPLKVDVGFLCDESPIHTNDKNIHNHLANALAENAKDASNIGLFIGPESSFTEEERAKILALKNIHSVSLGDAILRVPTASMVSVAMTQAFFATFIPT